MKKKIAIGVAFLGVILVASSAVLFSTETASVFAVPDDSPTATTFSSAAPTITPTADPVVAAPSEPTSTVAPTVATTSVAPSFDEMEAAIPTNWSADEIANAKVWLDQQQIITQCLADLSFAYTFTPYWLREAGMSLSSWESTLPAGDRAAAGFALWGETGAGADYHWDDAGCHGYAVHVTGMDHAN